MKKSNTLITCGATALFAAALGLQAQTSGSSNATPSGSNATSSSFSSSGSQSTPTTSTSSAGQFGGTSNLQSTPPSSSSMGSTTTAPSSNAGSYQNNSTNSTGSMSASGSANAAGSFSGSANTATSSAFGSTSTPSTQSNQNTYSTTQPGGASSGSFTNQQSAAQNTFSTTAQSETQVTTFVQQLDAQGPAVVQQISTQVGDLACSQDTIENLVEALHSGKSVTLTADVNGQRQTATFNASGAHLGYGEAYMAIALASQQLRHAGVTSCATPAQWQAVLLGGPLNVSTTSSSSNSFASASGSTQVPGIVTLHTQGQGWGQIAQSANLQLNQIVSNSGVSANTTTSSSSSLAPTGYSSAEMNQGKVKSDDEHHDNGKHKGEKKHWWSRDKDKDDHKSDENKNSSSTHADTDSAGASATSTPTTR